MLTGSSSGVLSFRQFAGSGAYGSAEESQFHHTHLLSLGFVRSWNTRRRCRSACSRIFLLTLLTTLLRCMGNNSRRMTLIKVNMLFGFFDFDEQQGNSGRRYRMGLKVRVLSARTRQEINCHVLGCRLHLGPPGGEWQIDWVLRNRACCSKSWLYPSSSWMQKEH